MITTDALRTTMQKNRQLIRGYGEKSPYSVKIAEENHRIGYALAYMKKYNKHAARDMEEVLRLAEMYKQQHEQPKQ